MSIHHFILTRFNIQLWHKDKEGRPVRSTVWLDHRFNLFEQYCLPSIVGQKCQKFEWIVLFDSTTPERFKARIKEFFSGILKNNDIKSLSLLGAFFFVIIMIAVGLFLKLPESK